MKTSSRVWFWLPRVLCIIAIVFISMFALDAFSPGLSIWQQIGAFLLHLVPSFVLLLLLWFAWKYEMAGGIVFILLGAIMTPVIFNHNRNINHFSVAQSINAILMVTMPFIIVGILFVLSYRSHRKTAGGA